LCDYSESSAEEEDEDTSREESAASPRKRKKGRAQKEPSARRKATLLGLPVRPDGKLDTEVLLHDPHFDPIVALTQRLDQLRPDCKDVDVEEEEAWTDKAVEDDAPSEFNLETLDFRKTLKKRPGEEHAEKASTSNQAEKEDESEPQGGVTFLKPRFRNRKFVFKPFKRLADGKLEHDEQGQTVDVVVPEQLAASYGLYIWPSSPVLAWYVWLNREDFAGARVLELGAGTCLPGLLCAKVGASKVFLSDVATNPDVLLNCREAVKLNQAEDRAEVLGITWGQYEPDLMRLADPTSPEDELNFILGSDVFFEPSLFTALCQTLSFLLERHAKARALVSVQNRGTHHALDEALFRWGLRVKELIRPTEVLRAAGVADEDDIGSGGKHEVFVLDIVLDEDERHHE